MAINLFSPAWNIEESYGRVATELSNGLNNLGISTNCFGSDAPDKPVEFSFGGILMGYPVNYYKWYTVLKHAKAISLSMFESDALPEGWTDALNQFDGTIVPSSWLVDLYRNSGVTIPIDVIPLGISRGFLYKPRIETGKFRVVAIGDGGSRKACWRAMFAFVGAFGDDPDVELIIKARNFTNNRFSNKNIRVIVDNYSDSEMNELYQSADMMVFPSCGEGFGLPPLEFAKTGGIVAATNWSGMADYINEIGFPISYEMGEAWAGNKKLAGVGKWAEADIEEIVETMRHVRSMSVEERNKMGLAASEYVSKNYRWDTFAQQVKEVWEREIANTRTA